MVARRALSVWGREAGSKRLFALAEPLAFASADPAVVPEGVLEAAPVFEFASAEEVLSGPSGDVVQPHSMAASKLS
jgi:hypothetical protein